MMGRVILGGAFIAACALAPAAIAAQGGGGLMRAHPHFFHGHHGFWPYGNGYGYGYGYGYGAMATYTPDYGAPSVAVVPVEAAAPSYAPPPAEVHCTHSVQTVTVPGEDGAEHKVTITRC